METGIIEIKFKDERIYRVFYANSSQRNKLAIELHKINDKVKSTHILTNGIHSVKQLQEQLKYI